jgi:hypothetical protein
MSNQKPRLPRYARVKNPPSIRLTERDKHILEAIYAYDGMLGFSQIRRMFFTGKSQVEQRMKLLYQHRYINRPNKEQRRRLPEMIYWLDKRGAEIVASRDSTPMKEFSWRKAPRWFQVEHDSAVNDFRLNVEEACMGEPNVELDMWIPESEFWSYPDRIEYRYNDRKMNRYVRPDGFFILTTPDHHIRYLLEIDRSTEDNPRFLREKILPGLAYIRSKAYEERYGHRTGRWLVVTTSERRMRNMLRQAKTAKAKGLFYFTTYSQITVDRLLLTPIWQRADRDEPVPLLFID